MEAIDGKCLTRFGTLTAATGIGAQLLGLGFGEVVSEAFRETIREALETSMQDCMILGLPFTVRQIERMQANIELSDYQPAALHRDIDSLRDRLFDELDARLFMQIPAERAAYYLTPLKGWETVNDAFQSATVDIEESGKCFAAARYTATAFHLMRVMELGLRALATSLSDPSIDPRTNPSWDAILRKCRAELEKPLRDRSPEWRSDETFYSTATTHLMGVKDAWRNPTMHIQVTYTEETSLDIYRHVQAFMRHLATKLHEPS